MKQDVGSIQSDCRGFASIASIASKTKELFFDSVELDFSHCSFFEVNMTAPLYAVIAQLRDQLNDVSIENLQPSVEKIFRRNRFLLVFNQPALQDKNYTTLPFKIFKPNAEERFLDYLDTYLEGKGIPRMSGYLTKRFRQSLLEIFLNAAFHSKSEYGIFACGQFYPKKNQMDVTIADAGVSIHKNVCGFLGTDKINSREAIEWAMKGGNTTKKGKEPGGLGFTLITDFIRLNKGKLQIISNSGYFELSEKDEGSQKMSHNFPGTCINIGINTNDTNRYCLASKQKSENIF